MGGKTGLSKQPSEISSLQFQTAAKGAVVPLCWGTMRLGPIVIDYDDFTKHGTGGKGKGGGKGAAKTTYSASIIMALCQGPIADVLEVWHDKAIGPFDPGIATLYVGNDGQTADPFWVTNHAAKALGYSGTAVVVANNLNLGDSPALGNWNFETRAIAGLADAPNGVDCNPATIVADFLTNPRYGASFPSANLASLTDYRNYCNAVGIWLSPQLDTQQEAQQSLSDLTKVTNSAIVWSGGKLKIIPYGDATITASHTPVTLAVAVAAGDVYHLTFTDAGLAGSPRTVSYTAQKGDDLALVGYGLVKAANADAALIGFGASAISGHNSLLIRQQPAGSVAITGGSTGAGSVTIGATTTVTFAPDLTPAYSLGDDDFIAQSSSAGNAGGLSSGGAALRSGAGGVTGGIGDDPVKIDRTSPADANNSASLEYVDRTTNYNTAVAEASDQAAIDLYGLRRESAVSAHAICDPTIAQRVTQLGLQRLLLFRRTHTFQLGWQYCRLEPMDLVQITDARLGAASLTVRITAVEEDDEGTLAITAEDFIAGASIPVLYPAQIAAGIVINFDADPADVNAPLIFEPPAPLTGGQREVWIGLSGGPDFGSAQVFVSLDNTTYTPWGEITGPIRQGVSTASLPSSASPDLTHTLSVNLSESRGQLNSVSAGDAAAFVTLCLIDGELISFETAALTSAYHYDLTTLYRGVFGTAIGSHSGGAPFARLDDAIGRFAYPSNLVGQTVYFKFVASNLVGGGTQNLADVTAYGYTLNGAGAVLSVAVPIQFLGVPQSGAPVLRYTFGEAVDFPALFAGSNCTAGIGATALTTFNIAKNGVNFATMQFAIGSTVATFPTGGASVFAAGDVLTITPTSTDATLSDLSGLLLGSTA